MLNINDLIMQARDERASDIHISGDRPVFRVDGTLVRTSHVMSQEERERLIISMLDDEQRGRLENEEDIDMCYALPNGFRQRVNIFRQQRQLTAVLRMMNEFIPTFEDLGLPEVMRRMAEEPRGLILVTGPTGSGKSTTLAAMVNYINETRACHILTIEDPVEYVYKAKKALIHQRDIGVDTDSFAGALKSAMREDPDVILLGELRDYETISAAVTAAETGHLVFATLHTTGAAATIDRVIDVFPPHSQQQIRTQLASVLKGVITQTLLPKAEGKGRVAAFEIMLGTDAIANLIRSNKCHQINSFMQTSGRQGMVLLDMSLADLVRKRLVTKEDALAKAFNVEELTMLLSGRVM